MLINRKTLSKTVFALTIALFVNTTLADETKEFSVALWGDMPYARSGDTPKIQALIDDINASQVAFTIFDGNIKDGSSLCEKVHYTDAITRFNSFKKPMVYIPGDNE